MLNMEGNKTRKINKMGKRGGERNKLKLKGVERKSFNNHPHNQEPRALIQLKPSHKAKKFFGEVLWVKVNIISKLGEGYL